MPLFPRHPSRKLTALAHGELSPRETTRVERHLLSCPTCRRQASALARVTSLARNPERPEIPPLRMPASPDSTVSRRGPGGQNRVWALAFALAAAMVVVALVLPRRSRSPERGLEVPADAPLEREAVRLHRERLRGTLSFDMCDGSADQVRTWVCRESGLETETPPAARGGRACASLVTAAGAPAALVAFDSHSRPLTLVTARRQDLGPGWPARAVALNDPDSGVSLRAWTDADQAFVLVSGLPSASPVRERN